MIAVILYVNLGASADWVLALASVVTAAVAWQGRPSKRRRKRRPKR